VVEVGAETVAVVAGEPGRLATAQPAQRDQVKGREQPVPVMYSRNCAI
jgi:hypothetical protein